MLNANDLKINWAEQQPPSLMPKAEPIFILQRVGTLWREHLHLVDALRKSVGLRGYGQKEAA